MGQFRLGQMPYWECISHKLEPRCRQSESLSCAATSAFGTNQVAAFQDSNISAESRRINPSLIRKIHKRYLLRRPDPD
jgi:hypothetical protein